MNSCSCGLKKGAAYVGARIDVLLYGEGNKIAKGGALEEYGSGMLRGWGGEARKVGQNDRAEQAGQVGQFLYFGDLDLEGIRLFFRARERKEQFSFGYYPEDDGDRYRKALAGFGITQEEWRYDLAPGVCRICRAGSPGSKRRRAGWRPGTGNWNRSWSRCGIRSSRP